MDIEIDPEIAALIPPPTDAERMALETSLLAEGCRDALVVWRGVLLDGHNRHSICSRHHLKYRIQELSFAGKNEAMAWVIDNQLARRNLNADAIRYLRGKRYESQKQQGARTDVTSGQFDPKLRVSEHLSHEYHVGEKTIRRDEQFAKELDNNPDLKKKILGGKTTYRKVRQEIRRAKVKEALQAIPLPQQKHRVFLADPPWQYGNSGLDDYGHAERHYPTMTLDELRALPVEEMADADAVLFLWATSPLLPDALRVMEAWGFQYKTSFVWDKIAHNFGYYNSVRHELLLVGTRGSCLPDVKELTDSVVSIERGRHSEKPAYFRELIDRLYTAGRRIELFARTAAPGWESWGNQLRKEGNG